MIKLPEIIGLTLCERLEVAIQKGQVSLVGLFHALRFPVFPSPVQRFTIYLALYDGDGEGTIDLSIMHLASEKVIYRYQKWLKFPGRGLFVNQEFLVRKCVFPAPGRYSVKLTFDRQLVTKRYLSVFQD